MLGWNDVEGVKGTNPKRRARHSRTSFLRRRAQKGFRGYPIATVAYYGPDDTFSSKAAVGIILQEGGEVALLERWFAEKIDVRLDPSINREIGRFAANHKVRPVVIADGTIGCPREEGIDYPEGERCPQCPYWSARDEWTGELIAGERVGRVEETVAVGVAWFSQELWERLVEIAEDSDVLGETYEEWVRNAEKALRDMRKVGMFAERVEVDVEELSDWCREHGYPVDGGGRARYVAQKVAGRHQQDDE